MMVIDGGFGEGGGQILRTALSMSLLTLKPFQIENIRRNRSTPGLAPQHLVCVRSARDVSLADVEGDSIGSGTVQFLPRAVRAGSYRSIISTAGATSLVLQTLLPPLSLAGGQSSLEVFGGTHVPWSPSADFLLRVYLPALRIAGFRCDLELVRAGFYPKGGGAIRARIRPPESLTPTNFTGGRGERSLSGIASVSGLPKSIAERMRDETRTRLARESFTIDDFPVVVRDAPSPGAFVGLVAVGQNSLAGAFTLAQKGKPAEKVVVEPVARMCDYLHSRVGVDDLLADQLVVPLASLNIPARWSTTCVTKHLFTNVQVVNTFLPGRVCLNGELGSSGFVEIVPT